MSSHSLPAQQEANDVESESIEEIWLSYIRSHLPYITIAFDF